MSKVRFEEAELSIIAMFEEETREDTIAYIKEATSFLEEEDDEIRELMDSAVEKLKQLPEEEFKAFDYSKYLFEEDEDES